MVHLEIDLPAVSIVKPAVKKKKNKREWDDPAEELRDADAEYLSYHQSMVGQRVLVLGDWNRWEGVVKSVVDKEYFIVSDGREDRKVSMFFLRSLD